MKAGVCPVFDRLETVGITERKWQGTLRPYGRASVSICWAEVLSRRSGLLRPDPALPEMNEEPPEVNPHIHHEQ